MSRDRDHAPLGGHSFYALDRPRRVLQYSAGPVYQRKKEVSSFTRSKVTEGFQNLKSGSRDHDHALLGFIHHLLCSTRRTPIYQRKKMKCLAL